MDCKDAAIKAATDRCINSALRERFHKRYGVSLNYAYCRLWKEEERLKELATRGTFSYTRELLQATDKELAVYSDACT